MDKAMGKLVIAKILKKKLENVCSM